MARRSKVDSKFFQEIPKGDDGKTWKKTDKWKPAYYYF
jgi:hypothetical protein